MCIGKLNPPWRTTLRLWFSYWEVVPRAVNSKSKMAFWDRPWERRTDWRPSVRKCLSGNFQEALRWGRESENVGSFQAFCSFCLYRTCLLHLFLCGSVDYILTCGLMLLWLQTCICSEQGWSKVLTTPRSWVWSPEGPVSFIKRNIELHGSQTSPLIPACLSPKYVALSLEDLVRRQEWSCMVH